MNKKLISIAVATIVSASSANAAVTIFENDTTRVENYGRINLILQNKDGDNDVINNASRLGLRASNQIAGSTQFFTNLEFRFDASQKGEGTTSVQEIELRNTYVGFKGDFGRITVGNFDSLYKANVSGVLDLPENDGFRALVEAGRHARGDSIAYESNNLGGVRFGVAAKHYSVNPNTGTGLTAEQQAERDSEINIHAYLTFQPADNLTLGLGFNQNNGDTGERINTDPAKAAGDDASILGFSATYELDDLTGVFLAESGGELLHLGVGLSYSYGSGNVFALASWQDNGVDSGVDFGIGGNYRFSSAFRVYAELAQGNDDNSKITVPTYDAAGAASGTEGTTIVNLGLRYDW